MWYVEILFKKTPRTRRCRPNMTSLAIKNPVRIIYKGRYRPEKERAA
jgi:hypothetical protein